MNVVLDTNVIESLLKFLSHESKLVLPNPLLMTSSEY
jgi:hypothetical protein